MFKYKIFDTLAIALPVLLLVMVYYDSRLMLWLILGISILCLNHVETIIPVYFISSLSNAYFSVGDGSSSSRYIYIVLLLSLLLNCIRHKSTRFDKNSKQVLLLIVIAFFSCLVSYTGELLPFFQMFQTLLIILFLPMCRGIDVNKLFIIICISCVLVIITVSLQALTSNILQMTGRYNMDGEVNANRIGMMIAQCCAFIIATIVSTKSKMFSTILILPFLVGLILIILTGSRSAMIAAVSASLICFLWRMVKYKERKAALLIIGLLVASISYFLSNNEVQTIDRFSVDSVEASGGTSRMDNITVIMTKIFPDHFWFGSGLGGDNMKKLGKQYSLKNLAHNIIIDPLSQLGIFFYTFYMFFVVPIVLNAIRNVKRSSLALYIIIMSPLTASIFNGVGETIFFEKFFWFELSFCVWINNLRKQKLLYSN